MGSGPHKERKDKVVKGESLPSKGSRIFEVKKDNPFLLLFLRERTESKVETDGEVNREREILLLNVFLNRQDKG